MNNSLLLLISSGLAMSAAACAQNGNGAVSASPPDLVQAGGAQQAAACGVASLMQRRRVKPETDFYELMTEQSDFWSSRLEEAEPSMRTRTDHLKTAMDSFDAHYQDLTVLEGMTAVASIIRTCSEIRAEIE